MASTRELRRRIRSVKNTAQITKAMQMVAATKMRRAQLQAMAGRPYLEALQTSLGRLLSKVGTIDHPLVKVNKANLVKTLVLSTDRALCGALNTNLFRATQNFYLENKTSKFLTIGKKGRNFIVKSAKELEADFENKDVVEFADAAQIAKMLIKSFLAGEIKEAFVIYPHFVSTLTQEPRVVKILPIDPASLMTSTKQSLRPDGFKTQESTPVKSGINKEHVTEEFLLEPNATSLLEYTLAHFVETSVYQTMLETKASEHSARMIAMQNATDNAKELVSDLELAYNQTRQEGITNELLEITSAIAALE